MIENEQHEVELSQGARKVVRAACDMARIARVALTGMHWHRGHEVADMDDRWLTLETKMHAVTEHFPNEWLEACSTTDSDPRVARCLSGMLQALGSRSSMQSAFES